ncbi:MAG TPA: hypothetical protein VM431_00705 [Phycisphaerae bacterium]|nr:hypothetical protein [Phycisphaerae bacterium]
MPTGFNITPSMFFDRPLVKRALDLTTRQALGKAGATIRTIARRSMRYTTSTREQARLVEAGRRKRIKPTDPAPPGSPPRAVRPHPWIRKFLFYGYEPATTSVVVGPTRLPGSQTNIPALHEFGGTATMRNRRRRIRRVGDGGEIRVGGRPGRTTRKVVDVHGRPVMVTFARLSTAAQAAHADRLNAELFGPAIRHLFYPARSYMGPALSAALPSTPALWKARLAA